jgi:hypothetical protein
MESVDAEGVVDVPRLLLLLRLAEAWGGAHPPHAEAPIDPTAPDEHLLA